jgi:hypothetical protein
MQTIKCVVVGDAVNEPNGDDKKGLAKVAFLTAYTTNKYPSEYIPSVVSFRMSLFLMIFRVNCSHVMRVSVRAACEPNLNFAVTVASIRLNQ